MRRPGGEGGIKSGGGSLNSSSSSGGMGLELCSGRLKLNFQFYLKKNAFHIKH